MTHPVAVKFLDRTTPPHVSTLIVLAGVSAAVMNMFLPSLPNMAAHFGVPYSLMQLSVPLYLGFSAILQTIIGPLSDKFGRRKVTLWGVGLFVAFSFGCIIAPNVEVFLFCRMGQASVAVGMVLSRAAIRDMFDQNQAASMIGYVTMGMALVPMISPMIGGVLDQWFGWQSVFWGFLILGMITFVMAYRDMGETAAGSDKSVIEQFRQYPELLRSPRFWGYALAASFCSGAFFSYLGGAPFIGSEIFGMSPAVLGLYFGAPAVGYALGNYATGRFAERLGINRLILIGCIVNAAGVALSLSVFLLGLGSPVTFFGFMSLVGIGNGLVIPNATAGLLSVRPLIAGAASGLGGAIMIGGGALLSALAGSLLTLETGAYPLLYIQLATGLAAIASICLVLLRERQIGIA